MTSSDARAAVRAEVAAIDAFDALERDQIADALAWIDSGAPLFRVAKPDVPPTHLVSYFALVDDDHVLLVDHRNAGLWLPSGGHVEPDEHPRETVRRELAEELGLVLDADPGRPRFLTRSRTVGATAGHEDVSLWYVLRGDRDRELAFDRGEFHSVRWFGFSDAPLDRADPNLGRFLAKLRGRVDG